MRSRIHWHAETFCAGKHWLCGRLRVCVSFTIFIFLIDCSAHFIQPFKWQTTHKTMEAKKSAKSEAKTIQKWKSSKKNAKNGWRKLNPREFDPTEIKVKRQAEGFDDAFLQGARHVSLHLHYIVCHHIWIPTLLIKHVSFPTGWKRRISMEVQELPLNQHISSETNSFSYSHLKTQPNQIPSKTLNPTQWQTLNPAQAQQ